MIYAVVKDNQVVSFLLYKEQIEFLQKQEENLSLVPVNIEWDPNNPILLNRCLVQSDGTITITESPTE